MKYLHLLFCVLLVFSLSVPINSKRFSSGGSRSHSYPRSSGHSGGGSHSYPSSGGHSGGGSHSYPSSGGLSGGGHGYPSSGGSHGYPSSGGSHAYPSSGGLSGGGHGYPSSSNAGKSNHGYPAGGGLSGNSPSNTRVSHTTTNVHYHYNYNPPQQIRYSPVHGGVPISYPVYHGSPPTYVYQYRDSGSKYGTLLAGLALLNLGTVAGGAYALSKRHSDYKPQPGEVCRFGVKKDSGDYEETKIDCHLITSFIFQEEAKTPNAGNNGTVVTTTVTNVTIVNTTNGGHDAVPPTPIARPLYEMLPNGTLVPVNGTIGVNGTITNATESSPNKTSSDNTMTSSVTITTTNTTTVSNALDVKGAPISVTPGMQCYVLRHTPTSNMKRSVPCGLLQTYAEKSLKRNSASKNVPLFTVMTAAVALLVCY